MKKLMLLLTSGFLIAGPALCARVEFTKFDQNHSTIGFAVPILDGMSQIDGKFTTFSISLSYDDQDVTKSSVTAVIQASSITTGITDRDADLRSSNFFDVAKYPEIRFTSTAVAKTADGLRISGLLDLHGVQRPVELTCQIKGPQSDAKPGMLLLGAAAATSIDRRDFGIAWEHPVPHFVGDNVLISLHLISKLTPASAPAAPQAPPHR
jgi:polyisoprenoid-binding protein YceI